MNELGTSRSTRLPGYGVPSSSVHPSPRTWSTTSVSVPPPAPEAIRSTIASARCCARLGHRKAEPSGPVTARGHDAPADASHPPSVVAGRDVITAVSMAATKRGRQCGREPERTDDHAVDIGPPREAAVTVVTPFGLLVGLVVELPTGQRRPKMPSRRLPGERHQLHLVVDRRDTGQLAHLRVRQLTPGERRVDVSPSPQAPDRSGSTPSRCTPRRRALPAIQCAAVAEPSEQPGVTVGELGRQLHQPALRGRTLPTELAQLGANLIIWVPSDTRPRHLLSEDRLPSRQSSCARPA